MASVFKRGGKRNKHGWYFASFTDETGARVTRSTRTAEKSIAEEIARKWESDVARRREGTSDPDADAIAAAGRRDVAEHAAEYIDDCKADQDSVHVENKARELRKLLASTGARTLRDLSRDAIEAHLREIIAAGRSPRTRNHALQTFKAFLGWCVERKRLGVNPLAGVEGISEHRDRRRDRRALTLDEVQRLLEVSPPHRRLYYSFALWTGLRVKAVKAARWRDVDFADGKLRVKAVNAKGKTADQHIALHPRLLAELAAVRPTFNGNADPVFPTVPLLKTFKLDLKRAGIEFRDADGLQVDRHALRTTLGTLLAQSGVSVSATQKMLGHSDPRITAKHYTKLTLADTRLALAALPELMPDSAQRFAQRAGGFHWQSGTQGGNNRALFPVGVNGTCRTPEGAYNAGNDSGRQSEALPVTKIEQSARKALFLRAISSVG